MAYADELQAVSVDEALIDVTSRVLALKQSPPSFGEAIDEGNEVLLSEAASQMPNLDKDTMSAVPPAVTGTKDWSVTLAEKIRADVKRSTGCEGESQLGLLYIWLQTEGFSCDTVSIGIASNIMLARLATRHAKPARSFHLAADKTQEFLKDLDVGELPNFGYSTKKKIEATFGTSLCGQLLNRSKGALQACLGDKTGETLFKFVRGIDERKLEPQKERKSVSAEVNVSSDLFLGVSRITLKDGHSVFLPCSMESASFPSMKPRNSSTICQKKSRADFRLSAAKDAC